MKSCLFYFLSLIFSLNLLLSAQPVLADEETSQTYELATQFYAPAPVMEPKHEITYVAYQEYNQTVRPAPTTSYVVAMPYRATLAPWGVVSGEGVPVEAEEHGEAPPEGRVLGGYHPAPPPVAVAVSDGIPTAIPGYRPIPGEVHRPNSNEPAPLDEVAANDFGSGIDGNEVFGPARNGLNFNGGGCSLASATGGIGAWDLLCLGGLFLPLLRRRTSNTDL